MYLQKIAENLFRKFSFFGVLKVNIKKRHESADPDPHQNVMDPEH
jgi:hypothetical protein